MISVDGEMHWTSNYVFCGNFARPQHNIHKHIRPLIAFVQTSIKFTKSKRNDVKTFF